jgi:hypothetical protein
MAVFYGNKGDVLMPQEITSSGFPTNLDPLRSKCPPPPAQATEAPLDIFDEDAIRIGEYRAYLRVVEGRQLRFEGPDPATGELREVTVPASSTSRYFQAGRNTIKRKLIKRLGKGRTPGVLLTLTIDPKRFTKSEAWDNIWQHYKAFRRDLWKFLKRHGWKHNPLYVAVLEQHKSGYPHMHVAYPGLRYLAPKEIINGAWRMGTTDIKGGRGRREVKVSPLGYVLKYIRKLSGWTEEGLAYLWASRSRLYNISPKLYAIPKVPKAPGWTLCAIGYVDPCLSDLARRIARRRFLERAFKHKEVNYTPLLSPVS